MRFLVDAKMSPRLTELLRTNGHDAIAVRDVGLADASDDEILDHMLWVFAIAFGATWHRCIGAGPLERIYRSFGG